ncbi:MULTISPECIES: cytochrome P450 family protein [Actinomadura]|uniref:Cytochrome P450 n=1 Tax=Actinomadura yumaensis TaxID=111807 RepID=A0ABW2CJY0_9ACTN|nr:cytochrome P450 [Actinomadura sp. J1-007]MWK40050.1 cytochrome P450 [Actinomadura sp. J1-007]
MADTTDRFEELDDAFFADPYRAYRRWGERGVVHKVRFSDGRWGWVVTGYEEGRAALADPRLRKSGANARWFGGEAPSNSHMLDSDPPDHTRLRRLVNKAFTPRAVERLRPRVEEITGTLLDGMASERRVDLVASFAVPLPITVIGEVLGVPAGERIEFRRRAAAMFQSGGSRAVAQELMGFLGTLVQSKRERPADDLLSDLVRARDDGDRLTERELVATAFLLLFAGHETTVSLIGNGTYALLRNPDQLKALRADPELLPAAIEEFLRYDGPVGFATLRYAAEPMAIGGQEIAAGEFVHVAIGAANRDPAKYAEPDRLDITRDTAGHVAFGHGIHYCVGAPLARMEGTIAFSRMLERFPALRLADEAQTPRWHEAFRIRGLVSLPVALS